jgi:hypothetical protein
MKLLAILLLWFILVVLCWPLALLALVLWPLFWLLSIPFRILGALLEGLVAFVRALFLFPSRILHP